MVRCCYTIYSELILHGISGATADEDEPDAIQEDLLAVLKVRLLSCNSIALSLTPL